MPWMHSKDLDPPLTALEREKIADGAAIVREVNDDFYVVSPRSIITSYGIVTGCGVTFGPNGENTFLHRTGHTQKAKDNTIQNISKFVRGLL